MKNFFKKFFRFKISKKFFQKIFQKSRGIYIWGILYHTLYRQGHTTLFLNFQMILNFLSIEYSEFSEMYIYAQNCIIIISSNVLPFLECSSIFGNPIFWQNVRSCSSKFFQRTFVYWNVLPFLENFPTSSYPQERSDCIQLSMFACG